MTAPRPMRSSWCIGMTERPSTTEISTLTPATLEDMKDPMDDGAIVGRLCFRTR